MSHLSLAGACVSKTTLNVFSSTETPAARAEPWLKKAVPPPRFPKLSCHYHASESLPSTIIFAWLLSQEKKEKKKSFSWHPRYPLHLVKWPYGAKNEIPLKLIKNKWENMC